jgi:hypothetical protein
MLMQIFYHNSTYVTPNAGLGHKKEKERRTQFLKLPDLEETRNPQILKNTGTYASPLHLV